MLTDSLSRPSSPAPATADRRRIPRRLFAFLTHIAISCAIAALLALGILGWMYPGPTADMVGGRQLFWLVIGVDVVLGPLLTLVAFNERKPVAELRRDLLVIATLQMAALAYGVHTVAIVRPVAMVFEVKWFRLVTANAVLETELPRAPDDLRALPWNGPRLISVRQSAEGSTERAEQIASALRGYDIGQRPSLWQPYPPARAAAVAQGRPLDALLKHHARSAEAIRAALERWQLPIADARFVPVVAPTGDWIAILRANGDVAGYLPYDGFF